MKKEPVILTQEFKYVLDTLTNTNTNVFLTGKAGTGKSTLLQLITKSIDKKTVVVAPTGVAALNVRGQTIHSFFRLPPKLIQPKDIRKVRQQYLYKNIELLIIDEISMVRADLLDGIDRFLRINRGSGQPFGGVQVLFVGDLFQLPPVISSMGERQVFQNIYESPYFFSAQVFERDFDLEVIELQRVFRQKEKRFLELLNAVRLNTADYDTLEELNSRYFPDFTPPKGIHYITLTATNATANRINRQELDKLTTPARQFMAKIKGDVKPSAFPTEQILTLKEGAQIMFIRNDPERRYVNGSIGSVLSIKGDEIRVEVHEAGQRNEFELEPYLWEIIKYKVDPQNPKELQEEVLGSFEQYPVKLAWAVTIHKAQGKTFDRAIIDLGRGAFEHGQAYVALSRCRSLEGIILRQKLRPQDIMTDPLVVDFYQMKKSAQ